MNLLSSLPPAVAAVLLCQCAVGGPPSAAPAQAPPGRALALERIANHPAGDNRLFLEYDPAGKAVWNPAWPGQVDMTGVAWDSARSATAITPRHVVMAAHFPRKAGDTLAFHDRSGVRHTRTLEKVVSFRKLPVAADIAVGLLDRPLPDEIKTYPLLEPRADYADRLSGGLVLVTEQKRRLFIHEILFVSARSVKFVHGTAADPSVRTNLVVGDSGNPSFILVNGEPVLLETHTIGGAGAGPFYSAPPHFDALQTAVRELDPDYQLETRTLEPGYTEAAKARRAAGGTHYAQWNTDGSLTPRPSASPQRPVTNPAVPTNPADRKPADPRVPRVRRLPAPKAPTPQAPAPPP